MARARSGAEAAKQSFAAEAYSRTPEDRTGAGREDPVLSAVAAGPGSVLEQLLGYPRDGVVSILLEAAQLTSKSRADLE